MTSADSQEYPFLTRRMRSVPWPQSTARIIMWTPIVPLTFPVAIMAVSVILSATQARRDATTMFAVGADRRFLVSSDLRTDEILALGVPVGIGSGLAMGTLPRRMEPPPGSERCLARHCPAWSVQVGIGAVVVLVGLLAGVSYWPALLVTSSGAASTDSRVGDGRLLNDWQRGIVSDFVKEPEIPGLNRIAGVLLSRI